MINTQDDNYEIKDHVFHETLSLIKASQNVFIQDSYNLHEKEFNIIAGKDKYDNIGTTFLTSAIILSIEILSKNIFLFLNQKNDELINPIFYPDDKFEKWKLITVGILIIIYVILLLLTKFLPSERNKIINKIKTFFEKHPPTLKSIHDE